MERNDDGCLSHVPSRAHNPGTCPNRESKRQPFALLMTLNKLNHAAQCYIANFLESLHIDANHSHSTIWEKSETPLELGGNSGFHTLHLFSFPRG